MRAAVLNTSGSLDIEDVEPAPLRLTDVLVRITAANNCITDVFAVRSQQWYDFFPKPQILGHGGVGIVEAVGDAVKRIEVGDRVIVTANPMCNSCWFCLQGRHDMCTETVAVGPPHSYAETSSRTGDVFPNVSIGAYAQYAVVPEQQTTAIAAEVSDTGLALLADGLGAGLGAALITAPIRRGAQVAVLGCGSLGLGYIQGARVAGADRIIGIDPLAHRREMALAVGATDVLDPGAVDVVEAVKEMTDEAKAGPAWTGAEYTYDASGDDKAIEQAFHMTRPAGNVVLASMTWYHDPERGWLFDRGRVELPAFELSLRGKTIHSSQFGWIHILRDLPRLARLIERGDVDDLSRWSEDRALEDIATSMDRIWNRDVVASIIRPNG